MVEGAGGVVFNVVWTGEVFTYLRYFVCSILHHSGARMRFVANGCSAESIADMERFAAVHEAVIEVIDVSPDEMVAHGVALDRVRSVRDDGEYFCLVDADIRACGPFLDTFLQLLSSHAAVTSGREVWNDDNVVPAGHGGVGGRHFFDADGFVFGSPHLAFYNVVRSTRSASVGRSGSGPPVLSCPLQQRKRSPRSGTATSSTTRPRSSTSSSSTTATAWCTPSTRT